MAKVVITLTDNGDSVDTNWAFDPPLGDEGPQLPGAQYIAQRLMETLLTILKEESGR